MSNLYRVAVFCTSYIELLLRMLCGSGIAIEIFRLVAKLRPKLASYAETTWVRIVQIILLFERKTSLIERSANHWAVALTTLIHYCFLHLSNRKTTVDMMKVV